MMNNTHQKKPKNRYSVRFVPLGGILGVTKNMYVYELYEDRQLKDILIVDCGIGFPQDKALGVDFIIPDVTYLLDKVDKIRAILLTHAHEDHITALPYHYEKLGRPPMYTSLLTASFIKNKFVEFQEQVDPIVVDYDREYQFGDFRCEFIHSTHSIPDPMHILIKTPVGAMYHGADYKLDLTPPYGEPPDLYKMAKAGHDGVLCLLSDCLGADRDGLTLSESIVGQTFEDEMRKTKGKFVMTTFSSNISRIRQCVEAAIKFNRKICFLGRSMLENTRMAQEIGYLPIPDGFLIQDHQVKKMPANKVCIIAPGSQGQYNSAMARLASNSHRTVSLKAGDKVLFSSDPIPGNEPDVYELIEDLIMMGVEVIHSDVSDELHASGHGNRDDMKFLIRLTKPKFHIPIGGTVRHQRSYQRLVTELGGKRESVFTLSEGETVIFDETGPHTGPRVDTRSIYVDAQGVGDVGSIVLRDRKTLSTEGIVVAVLSMDAQSNAIVPPRIISRGFVFEKKEEDLFQKAEAVISKKIKGYAGRPLHMDAVKKEVSHLLEDYFFKERGRKPIVIVDVLQL